MTVLSATLFGQFRYNHPEIDWQTFDTEHFQIHFYDGTESTAREGAYVAEQIFPHVTALYDYEPQTKTDIIFTDFDDFSNGAAYADLDNDGDLDYVVNNINDKAFLFRNTFNKSRNHNFLKVKLEGSITNRLGIGAKIVLRQLDNSFQYYEHFLTRGYMSSMDHIIHFGLGENKNLKAIEIYWPDGAYQKKNMILSNNTLTFKHNEASIPDKKQLSFPLVPKDEQNPQFIEVSKKLGINYTHEEQDVIDFNIQYTLPHKLSQNGPCLAGGDLNGDGLQDFIIGSAANYSPTIYFQTEKGTFNKEILYNDQSLTKYEETAIEVFDIDNDEDMDIYLATGSYEFYGRKNLYKDIILINNGRGKFIVDTTRLSSTTINTAVAKAIDFNKDGYTDLFIGGSTKPGAYPLPENSFLLMNKNGILTDVTKEYAPELQNIGIITDATWTDINHDNLEDLVVVGEYMPITIFENTSKGFQKIENTGLADYLGWWKCIMPCDMDLDGDTDFIVGNIGENNFFHPTKTYPLTLIAKDFDNNGSIEPLLFSYFKNNQGELEQYPVSFWGDLTKLSPIFRKKFKLDETIKIWKTRKPNVKKTLENMRFYYTGLFIFISRSLFQKSLGIISTKEANIRIKKCQNVLEDHFKIMLKQNPKDSEAIRQFHEYGHGLTGNQYNLGSFRI